MDPWLVWRWFTRSWWHILLDGNTGWRNVWCRARGHPSGVRWFRSYGDSPDMRCRYCGEDLG